VFGVDSHVLSPKETKELYPLMNVDDLYGTLYSPGDGTIDPAGWATTLTRAAKNCGAQVKKEYFRTDYFIGQLHSVVMLLFIC
jgi:sarcosine dehydrogenase